MSAAKLEAAMADMEAARAALDSSATRVGDELERLRERVSARRPVLAAADRLAGSV